MARGRSASPRARSLTFKVPLNSRGKALIAEKKKIKGDVRVTVRDDTGDGPTRTVKVTFKK